MKAEELATLLKNRRNSLNIELTKLAQLGEFTTISLRNLEQNSCKTRCDIVLWYINALGGEMIVDSLCISKYDDIVMWFETMKRSNNLTNYMVSKETGVSNTVLNSLKLSPNRIVNIHTILYIITKYSKNIEILWKHKPITSGVHHFDRPNINDYTNILKQIRLSRNITIEEVSKISGIDEVSLNNIDSCNGRPRVNTILKYARAIKCSVYIQIDDIEYVVWSHEHIIKWISDQQEKCMITIAKLSKISNLNVDVIRRALKGETTLTLLSCINLIYALGGKIIIK